MGAVIEVEDVPATDRIEILREHMLRAPVPLELRPFRGRDLRVSSRVAAFGRVHLLSTMGSGAAVVRTERLARADSEPRAIVTVLGAGQSAVFQRDRLVRMQRGSIVLYSTTEPYWATFETNTVRHSFQIPVSALRLPESVLGALLASPLSADQPLTRIVTSHLSRLAREAATLSDAARAVLEASTLDLVSALLALNAGRADLAGDALHSSLRTRIFEFARLNLTDSELGAPMIANALGISERYVYAVIRSSGVSLGDWIRQQRVDAAAALLAGSSADRLSIAAVAHRFAFADHSHFTRSFRAVRGMTPSEWRRVAAQTAAGDGESGHLPAGG